MLKSSFFVLFPFSRTPKNDPRTLTMNNSPCFCSQKKHYTTENRPTEKYNTQKKLRKGFCKFGVHFVKNARLSQFSHNLIKLLFRHFRNCPGYQQKHINFSLTKNERQTFMSQLMKIDFFL